MKVSQQREENPKNTRAKFHLSTIQEAEKAILKNSQHVFFFWWMQ
jgi:hypothetical protein